MPPVFKFQAAMMSSAWIACLHSRIARCCRLVFRNPHRLMEDNVYNGMHIPKGSLVFGNIWAMLRNEEIYSEPDVFRPERFIDPVSPETEKRRNPKNYVFGFGRRQCPGMNLVESSVWLLIASMLATLDIAKAVDEHGNMVEPVVEFDNPIFSDLWLPDFIDSQHTTNLQNRWKCQPHRCGFVGIETDEDRLKTLISELEGKSTAEAEITNPQVAADLKKKCTFRTFSYRGVELDKLLDLSNFIEVCGLLHLNNRRHKPASSSMPVPAVASNAVLSAVPWVSSNKLRKAKEEAPPNEKPLLSRHISVI
ncbi:cytochrome P450 [Flammula alnicola]|nr:cytochrome P450 [Flammula alnicola]